MRLFGHPLHPMLVHLPVALWTLASACDGLTLLGFAQAWPFGWWCLIVGLGTAVPAMAAGLADFVRLPEPAVPTALRHMSLMGAAWTMEMIALLTRSNGLEAAPQPSMISMAAALTGFLLMAVGAWHGGQLIYRFAAGVVPAGGD
jgi:uncharacterized membrane protein